MMLSDGSITVVYLPENCCNTRSHSRHQTQLTAKIRKTTPSLVSRAQNHYPVKDLSNYDAKRSHTPPKTT
ncbi:hypothetical protein [Nostoc sp.]|uniref:hypothetical protein n=1 Tax=Nostoc sp. TaxID=1180 RepID=UPI002FFD5505